jgi:uncharacterized protein (TIGR02246 family)
VASSRSAPDAQPSIVAPKPAVISLIRRSIVGVLPSVPAQRSLEATVVAVDCQMRGWAKVVARGGKRHMVVEDEVQRLADIEAIKQLRGRYSRAVDTKDWELFGDSLTEDARLDSDGGLREGRDAIVAAVSAALATATTVHHQHTPEIEITGPDSATGIWAMDDLVHIGTFVLRGFGHYTEEYERTPEGWKIKRSTQTRLHTETEGEPPHAR